MSEYFEELTSLASNNKVSLLYEASVGGAIIILDELKRITSINQLNKIEGIVNGSTNYILSRVFQDDLSMKDAISEAFDQGYLETGSNDDIKGLDALRKLNILSMLSYHTYLKESDFYTVPLSSLSNDFIDYIKRQGLLLKYIATSELIDGEIVGHVTPVVLDNNSLLSRINYEENMITLYGAYHKKQSFIGQGAGRYPTASAILYDLINIKENNVLESNHTNTYKIHKEEGEYRFLVHSKKGIYQTNKITFKEILNDQEVICFAKVEEGNYEEN
jgi:homoserine dehydrogenase